MRTLPKYVPLSCYRSGRTRGSLATLEKLAQIFPEDISLKNDLGVAHLLLGDNKRAKQIYEEVKHRYYVIIMFSNVMWITNFPLFEIPFQVLARAPHDGFAKVHYGFILKSENKIAESIPYLRVILIL